MMSEEKQQNIVTESVFAVIFHRQLFVPIGDAFVRQHFLLLKRQHVD